MVIIVVDEVGEDGVFAGDFVEEVVVVGVLDELCALGLEVFDEGDAVVEGGDDLVPGGAVVGEVLETHDVVAVDVELVPLFVGEVFDEFGIIDFHDWVHLRRSAGFGSFMCVMVLRTK